MATCKMSTESLTIMKCLSLHVSLPAELDEVRFMTGLLETHVKLRDH